MKRIRQGHTRWVLSAVYGTNARIERFNVASVFVLSRCRDLITFRVGRSKCTFVMHERQFIELSKTYRHAQRKAEARNRELATAARTLPEIAA